MTKRQRLADRFFGSARWGIGRQLVVAAAVIIASVAVAGIVTESDDAGRSQPTRSTRAFVSPSPTATSPTPPAETSIEITETAVPPSGTIGPVETVGSPPTIPLATTTAATVNLRAGDVDALALLATIPVELEHPAGYNRDLFAIWSDLNGDGCDTRADVLIAESLTPAQVDSSGCTVVAGDWLSSYDGLTFASPADLDIDHVVALKEAWDSGAWQWSPERRIAYGNDTTDPRTLAAVSAASNRAKGDRDPSNWLPPDADAICGYLSDWVSIKARWHLSMDQSESGRIKNQLNARCPGLRIQGRTG